MNILIIGGGGREHALAWAVKKSPYCENLYVAPGNSGTELIAENVAISDIDIRSLASFAEKKAIDLTIVGPETPLSLGIVDYFKKRNLRIFGPSFEAAKIESSKVFSKQFMREHHIPTASYKDFSTPEDAIHFMEKREFPLVIKTDGLAGGKGVVVAKNMDEAKDAILHLMIEQNFGKAGKKVVIEEFLKGPEMSFMSLTDGKNVVPLITAMDYKQAYDSNTGPNTGGMGTIAPHPLMTPEIFKFVQDHVLSPAIDGLRHRGTPFTGILYAGLILTDSGPKVLEFNCRFGDPETQVVLPLLKTDFLEMLLHATEEKLDIFQPEWHEKKALCVVMASGGYPKRFKKGIEIEGLEKVADDVLVFHAGAIRKKETVFTDGGRVLGVTAVGNKYIDAAEIAYKAVNTISFSKSHFRTDIGSPYLLEEKLSFRR